MPYLTVTNSDRDVRFSVFMAVKIQIKAFEVVMLCNFAVGDHHFRGPYSLHL
jgi:hypothetical protein